MRLTEVKKGQRFVIQDIPDPIVRAQAIRLGMAEGSEVECAGVLPSGPVILRKNHQEIAVGRGLANQILIELCAKAS